MKKIILTVFLLLLPVMSFAEEQKPPPPCSSPEYRQFSFWLGKWTSYSKDGKKQGINHLKKVMGDCAMQENWQSGKYRGTSYNFYDAGTKKWYQTWVDNAGSHLFLSGGLLDNEMQLSGETTEPDGKAVTNRITWTPLDDGRVRQHWQSSVDGETWKEVFDGYYRKD